jgi:AcrR family transcriptional regulator
VLDAAARSIGAKGADRVRLRDVARTAGVSIGLIQHYFETRDALLHEAFEAFNNEFVQEWERISSTEPDPVERVDQLLRLSSYEADGWEGIAWAIWFEFWSICRRDEDFLPQYRTIYEEWRRPFREAIQYGVDKGHFAPKSPVDDVVDSLIAQIEGLRLAVSLEPARVSRDRMLALLRSFAAHELGVAFRGEATGRPLHRSQ